MLAYAPMLPYYYYAQNYASIIRQGLTTTAYDPSGLVSSVSAGETSR